MKSFSQDVEQLGLRNPQVAVMNAYFHTAKKLPELLVTQNQPLMKKAYTMVPAEIWADRVRDLQGALRLSSQSLHTRRYHVVAEPLGVSARVDQIVDGAFLDKYDELIYRVTQDFNDFFPYRITRSNRDLMIFEKIAHGELFEYVLNRI